MNKKYDEKRTASNTWAEFKETIDPVILKSLEPRPIFCAECGKIFCEHQKCISDAEYEDCCEYCGCDGSCKE